MQRLLWVTIFGLFITAGWALGLDAGDTAINSFLTGNNGEFVVSESETHNVDLIVQVTGGEPAEPIRNAEVWIVGSNGTEIKSRQRSDDNGQVNFQELPRGKITVMIIAKDWRTFKQTFTFNQRQELVTAILQPLD